MIKIANRTREIRPSGMKREACGNVMHDLASFCHEAVNADTMEGVALNMRAPYFNLHLNSTLQSKD